jgi:hypothetical protein
MRQLGGSAELNQHRTSDGQHRHAYRKAQEEKVYGAQFFHRGNTAFAMPNHDPRIID